jgi:Predicted N-acetylglucosamine kinase
MKYYIGIDGGGTKTKFLVGRVIEGTNADGSDAAGLEVIGEYTGGGCHYMQIGFDGLEELIRKGNLAVCENAGISPNEVDFAFIGFAGFGDVESDQPMIDEALAKAFGDMPYAAGNDLENALEGSLAGAPGINIIAGTGSNGGGRNSAGEFDRCGGWHYILGGDEGSAYWIAWNLLKEYSRQSDGRDEKTLLYDAVNKTLDLHTDDEMVTRVVNEWQLDRARIAGLAPVVSRLYDEGDPYAISILNSCAKELSDFAIVLYDKLGFAEDEESKDEDGLVPVSGTGGVFSIGPAVTEPFDSRLREHGMKYVKPQFTPDMGALMLAIKKSLE